MFATGHTRGFRGGVTVDPGEGGASLPPSPTKAQAPNGRLSPGACPCPRRGQPLPPPLSLGQLHLEGVGALAPAPRAGQARSPACVCRLLSESAGQEQPVVMSSGQGPQAWGGPLVGWSWPGWLPGRKHLAQGDARVTQSCRPVPQVRTQVLAD